MPGPLQTLRTRALAVALCAAAGTAGADILIGDFDQPNRFEMVFLAYETTTGTPRVSFVKDLGLLMEDFFVGAQQDAGVQYYWYLGAGSGSGGIGGVADPLWDNFLNTVVTGTTTVNPATIRWAVVGYDTRGDLTPGTLNLYTTVEQGTSGDPQVINGLSPMDGDRLQNGTASWFTYLAFVNGRGANRTATNGSVVVTVSDAPAFLCATGNPCAGSNLNYNGNLPGSAQNLVGSSSWFYAVTTADADFADTPVSVDEFDNLGADGYWGLAQVPGSTQYFLSYTLPAFASASETAAGVLGGSNFARLGGALSLSSPAGKAGSVLNLTEAFLRGLTDRPQSAEAVAQALGLSDAAAISPVPEPPALLLAAAGLALTAAAARRRTTRR